MATYQISLESTQVPGNCASKSCATTCSGIAVSTSGLLHTARCE